MKSKLWCLLLVLPLTLALVPQALPASGLGHVTNATCGSGDHTVGCTKTCCGTDVMTIYSGHGFASNCAAASSTCLACLPTTCPKGQTPCGTTTSSCLIIN